MSTVPSRFLFYDLETFGQDPRYSRIAQFAAVQTDASLQIIGQPHSFWVQPADDVLPSPQATLVTGITPQHALAQGMTESQAFARIEALMMQPQTCMLGYNSVRFDDEFIRYGLFRNFYDPYEREWRNGNSRHDVLEMLRLMHALRPEGLNWPLREDGSPSFKLEDLAAANALREGTAHEALSDVRATLALAQRLRQAQPRLWNYALQLRNKKVAAALLDVQTMTPVLHISSRYAVQRCCAAVVIPLALHPTINNRIIVFDLSADLEPLLERTPDEIAYDLYLRHQDRPEGQARVGLKEVHLNRAPMLVAWKHLRPPDFQRLHIDPKYIDQRAYYLQQIAPRLREKIQRVYSATKPQIESDVDAALYEGFIPKKDVPHLLQIRKSTPETLATLHYPFKDKRLPELLFRYRARNYPSTLTSEEMQRWNHYRRQRLQENTSLSEYSLLGYFAEITQLRYEYCNDTRALELLNILEHWGRQLQQSLNTP